MRQLGSQHLSGEPPPVPGGEIGILDGQLRQGRAVAARKGAVESRELVDQHPDRPAVADDVMEIEKRQAVGLGETQEGGAEEGPGLQVERPERFRSRQSAGFLLAPRGGETRQVDDRHRDRPRRVDDLPGLPLSFAPFGSAGHHFESRAERLVAPDDLPHAPVERHEVRPAGQP